MTNPPVASFAGSPGFFSATPGSHGPSPGRRMGLALSRPASQAGWRVPFNLAASPHAPEAKSCPKKQEVVGLFRRLQRLKMARQYFQREFSIWKTRKRSTKSHQATLNCFVKFRVTWWMVFRLANESSKLCVLLLFLVTADF